MHKIPATPTLVVGLRAQKKRQGHEQISISRQFEETAQKLVAVRTQDTALPVHIEYLIAHPTVVATTFLTRPYAPLLRQMCSIPNWDQIISLQNN